MKNNRHDSLETLTLTFENKKSVEITDFISLAQATETQYREALEKKGMKYEDLKLYVQPNEGSAELIFYLDPMLLAEAAQQVKDKLPLNALYQAIENIGVGDIKDIRDSIRLLNSGIKLLRMIIKDTSGKMRMSYESPSGKNKKFQFEPKIAKSTYQKIEKALAEKSKTKAFTNEEMEISVTKHNVIKGKIRSFVNRSKLIMCDDKIRSNLLKEAGENSFKDVSFIVSGEKIIHPKTKAIQKYSITKISKVNKN